MGYGLSPVLRSGARAGGGGGLAGRRGLLDPRRVGRALRRGDEDLRAARARRRAAAARSRRRATAARLAKGVADRLEPYAEHDGRDPLASSIPYPAESDFGRRLRYLAAMISKPLGIRVAHVEADGDFDTHDDQKYAERAARPT